MLRGPADDRPEPTDSFILADKEPKVEMFPDPKAMNTNLFILNREDHTLGNLISQRLHTYNYVTFSAYRIP
jgi:DNA-directed RNA polymerase II subunit RPB11